MRKVTLPWSAFTFLLLGKHNVAFHFNVLLIFFSYECSWGPIVWIVCSEIYPTRIRAMSLSLTTAFNWAMNATIAKVTPIMLAEITYGTYFFFGAMTVIMGSFAYIFLPETRGRSLEEINEVNRLTCI